MNFLNQMAPRCVLCVSKVFVTKLPSLRGEMVYMGIYWRRSAKMRIFKQTAWHCVLYVSKLFVTKLPALRGRGSSYLTKWWYNKSFETVGHLLDFRCRRMFQNCVHVAPGSRVTKRWIVIFETQGIWQRAVRFKTQRDDAPGASWRSDELGTFETHGTSYGRPKMRYTVFILKPPVQAMTARPTPRWQPRSSA